MQVGYNNNRLQGPASAFASDVSGQSQYQPDALRASCCWQFIWMKQHDLDASQQSGCHPDAVVLLSHFHPISIRMLLCDTEMHPRCQSSIWPSQCIKMQPEVFRNFLTSTLLLRWLGCTLSMARWCWSSDFYSSASGIWKVTSALCTTSLGVLWVSGCKSKKQPWPLPSRLAPLWHNKPPSPPLSFQCLLQNPLLCSHGLMMLCLCQQNTLHLYLITAWTTWMPFPLVQPPSQSTLWGQQWVYPHHTHLVGQPVDCPPSWITGTSPASSRTWWLNCPGQCKCSWSALTILRWCLTPVLSRQWWSRSHRPLSSILGYWEWLWVAFKCLL